MKHCPDCQEELPDSAQFCTRCGYDLTTTVKAARPLKHTRFSLKEKCPECGNELPVDAHFCGQCGHNLVDGRASLNKNGHSQLLRYLAQLLQSLRIWLLQCAGDPDPEKSLDVQDTQQVKKSIWNWFPLLTLTSTLGLIPIAYAYTLANQGVAQADIFFWLGLLVIFVPAAIRLLSAKATRAERIGLLCVVGICLGLIRVMISPFTFHAVDDYLHWRTIDDIARTGHLFSPNSVLPVSPFYPGLEIVTNALSTLSGLSTFYCAFIVLGIARLLVILSLFMFYEQITKSSRIAGIASIIYMANPHFLFFDTTFAYGSLAVALAAFVLFALAFRATLIACLALGALVVTHHVTDIFLEALLILWVLIMVLQRPARSRLYRSGVPQTALLGLILLVGWVNLKGNTAMDYLTSYFNGGIEGLIQILMGTSAAHQLFHDYAGQQAPLWERLTSIFSVVLIVVSLPFGLLTIWQRYRSKTLVCTLGVAALFYPLSQVFRFTNSGSEISDRAGAFLFISISCVLAIFITQFWPVRWLNWKQIPFLVAGLTILFIGGVVLGSGPPWASMPGPYLVIAGGRSIEPNDIQTAKWTLSYLGPDNRIATDNINRILLNSYGDQVLVTRLEDHIDVSNVFFSPQFGPYEESVLRSAKVRYLVVDLRLSTALPRYGFYFEPGEPGDYRRTSPIALQALTKFNSIPGIKRVYDSGDIVIYDVGDLTNAPEKP